MKKYECGLSWVKMLQNCDPARFDASIDVHLKLLYPKNPYEKCLIEEFEQELIKIIFDYEGLCNEQLLVDIAHFFHGLETDDRLKFLLTGVAEQQRFLPRTALNTYHLCRLITNIEQRSAELTKGA